MKYIAVMTLCALIVLFTIIRVFFSGKKASSASDINPTESLISKLTGIIDKFYIPFFILIFLVFLFTRLYYLGIIPVGIHVDELGMAYDAFSLSGYGMDRHHVNLPVYLENFGAGQSALYAYMTALLLRFFPYSVKLIRVPAVICGTLCFFSSFFLIRDIAGDAKTQLNDDNRRVNAAALLGPLFVTVIPYFMTSQRWGLDCNLLLSLATVSLTFTIRAYKSGRWPWYLCAGIMWGITFYTYVISYLIIPLFIILSSAYLLYLKREKKTFINICILMVPLIILGLPLLLFQLVNMGLIGEFSFLGTDFRRLSLYRGNDIGFSDMLEKLPWIIKSMGGGDGLTYNAFNEFGPVYLCMIPLILCGAFYAFKDAVMSFKKKELSAVSIAVIFFVSSWIVMLSLAYFGYNVANYIYLSHLIFMSYAVISLGRISPRSILVFLTCIGLSFLLFVNFYFREQTAVYGFHDLFCNTKGGDVIAYAEEKYDPQHVKKLYVRLNYDDTGHQNLMAGLYGKIPPTEWTDDSKDLGRIYMDLPENFDENEDAIYIIGSDEWSYVISELINVGFHNDIAFDNEVILYR